MKRIVRMLLFAAFAAVVAACTEAASLPVLSIEGGQVRGVSTGTEGVIAYKGVPFAAPPVGELRWQAPQPAVPWDGILEADTFGPPAMQDKHREGEFYTREFFFDGDPAFSEDCLYLNIWTKASGDPDRKLPVIMWIHGGAYVAGWSFEPEMDGEALASRDVVIVTVGYRLGIFGFFSHPLLSAESPDGVSGNYGMLDQIAALKWIHRNIAAFGGDPGNITIMGQSAGAASVQTLVTSPLSKDLVGKCIIQSGGGISTTQFMRNRPLAQAAEAGEKLMSWAGCNTLSEMRAIDSEDLLTLARRYEAETGEKAEISMAPVIDSVYLSEDFSHAALGSRIADIPYMIGFTRDDIRPMAEPIGAFCLNREEAGTPAYAYEFCRPLPGDDAGAFHSAELWYMFGSQHLSWRPFTEGDKALSDRMLSAWTTFAATGIPTCSSSCSTSDTSDSTTACGPSCTSTGIHTCSSSCATSAGTPACTPACTSTSCSTSAGEPTCCASSAWTPYTADSPLFMLFRLSDDDRDISAMGEAI